MAEYSDPDNDEDDVNDDELEQLARINAEFNTNKPPETRVESKGTITIDVLFTFLLIT